VGTATAVGMSLETGAGWDEALSVGYTFATVGLLTAIFGGMLLINVATRIDRRLAIAILRHILRLPVRIYDTLTTGGIVARVQGAQSLREFLTGIAFSTILDVVTLFAFMVLVLFTLIPYEESRRWDCTFSIISRGVFDLGKYESHIREEWWRVWIPLEGRIPPVLRFQTSIRQSLETETPVFSSTNTKSSTSSRRA